MCWKTILRCAPACVVAVCLAGAARADTTIVGGNIVNQTWTLSGSPYIVQGDVTVPAGAFLTIDPGVIVKVATTDGLAAGFDLNKIEFQIRGTLNVNGTSASPVVFQAQIGTVAGTWWGIYADPTAAAVNISGATIRHAVYGVYSAAPGSVLNVNLATVQVCQVTGVIVSAGTPTLKRLSVSACPTGIDITAGASATIQSSYMFLNQGAGLEAEGGPGTTTVTGCTFDSNGSYGIHYSGIGALEVYNTIVTRGSGYGVYRLGSGPMTVLNCDVFANSTANYFNVVPGSGCISADPLLVAIGDAHIQTGSPCIDTGDGVHCATPDLFGLARPADGDGNNGAQCDIGAHEFNGCASPTTITAGPSPVTVRVGKPWTLSVGATGANLTYQWRRNGVNLISSRGLTGATSSTVSADFAGLYDTGTYDAVVSGSCGTQISPSTTITVLPGCAADFNGDGALGAQDIFDYLNAWFVGCP
ncbi:MAG TPA: immunoglobulin domain-containing protein [Phycisphaerales bacterium]|jgi:hypothetical protein|nr:immunoglobulin domain-containing protein [Phycisphaerales bacterium]